MANERLYPILPCRELDESIVFYEVLGFKRTYRQLRPNPYATIALENIQIHLFGMDGFDPADSYGSVIIAVPDPDGLYQAKLAVRTKDLELARSSLTAAKLLDLTEEERAVLEEEFSHAAELVDQERE